MAGMNIRLGVRAGLTLVCFLVASALAQADLTLTVLAGAGGYVRTDAIVPVQVILANDDIDRTGRVVVSFERWGQTIISAWTAVPLPPDSRKSVFLYVPTTADMPERVTVTYENSRGRKEAEHSERLNALVAETPILGGVGVLPRELPDDEDAEENKLYYRLSIRPDQVPDRSEGLQMYDALIISPPPMEPLERDQVNALREWIIRGGALAVDASKRTDVFQSGTFRDLLPYLPSGEEQATLKAFGRETIFTSGTIRGGEILLESDNRPLVIRRNLGLGSITCFAVAPDDPALLNWSGREDLWEDVLGTLHLDEEVPDDGQSYSELYDRRQEFTSRVQAPQRTGLRLGLVLLLTALYALAVGPGDYWLVRKLGRPKLTWVTFPLIVTFFTVAAWLGAKAWIGGEMAAASKQRFLVCADTNMALRYDLINLFAPTTADYTLTTDNEATLQHISSGSASMRIAIDQDERAVIHRIPIWQSGLYGASGRAEQFPAVSLRLDRQRDNVHATVTNLSKETLVDGVFLYANRVLPAGNTLRPGKLDRADLEGSGMLNRREERTLSQRVPEMAQLTFGRRMFWAPVREFDLRDALRRGALIYVARIQKPSDNPLIVDGSQRPENTTATLVAVAYPRQEPITDDTEGAS
jgi:hypothetical protein